MKQKIGDLVMEALAGEYDVIVHGCNCHRNMGAGIALAIAQNIPEAYEADMAGDHDTPHEPGTVTIAETENVIVVNGYTQFYPGGPRPQVDSHEKRYNWIRSVFRQVNEKYPGCKVGIPLIGCGLAGLDWYVVKLLIELELKDVSLTVVHWEGDIKSQGKFRDQVAVMANGTWFFKESGEEIDFSSFS